MYVLSVKYRLLIWGKHQYGGATWIMVSHLLLPLLPPCACYACPWGHRSQDWERKRREKTFLYASCSFQGATGSWPPSWGGRQPGVVVPDNHNLWKVGIFRAQPEHARRASPSSNSEHSWQPMGILGFSLLSTNKITQKGVNIHFLYHRIGSKSSDMYRPNKLPYFQWDSG